MARQRDEILTPKELASEFKVSESTIYRMQKQWELPGVHVHGVLRFRYGEAMDALPRAPLSPAYLHRETSRGEGDLVQVFKQRARAYRVK